jgi:hypothetical protein
VLCHGTCGTGLVDSDPSFTTVGSSDLSILFRSFKAISREAVRFSARLPLYQGVTALVGVDLQVFSYVIPHSSIGVYDFLHFVFDCSKAVSVSAGKC